MRTPEPTARWWKRWQLAYIACGGHAGPATLKAIRPRASALYRLGGSAPVVGNVCAREYRLYTDAEHHREKANYLDTSPRIR